MRPSGGGGPPSTYGDAFKRDPQKVARLRSQRWYASEDFAYYLNELPGSFYRIGTGNRDRGIVHGLHTPRFTIDEDALRVAPGFMAFLALQYGAERA